MQTNSKIHGIKEQIEEMAYSAATMAELAMDLKDRTACCEKYSCYLRSLAWRAGRVIIAMQQSSRSFLSFAQKLAIAGIKNIDSLPISENMSETRLDLEKLLSILEKELLDVGDFEPVEPHNRWDNTHEQVLSDKVKFLEMKQKSGDTTLPTTSSSRSFKLEIDEKYPENWSKESFDLNSVVNLPPVPEDIFTTFNKPKQSSSFSSLRSLRKVKLCLQRACSGSDSEDEGSESQVSTFIWFLIYILSVYLFLSYYPYWTELL